MEELSEVNLPLGDLQGNVHHLVIHHHLVPIEL
jgi:hypothetical protein